MAHSQVQALGAPILTHAWRRWLALPVILAGTFMVTLDFFIVNVAIPSIQRELGADTAAIEWVVAGYGLTYAALLITGGRLGDLYGRRRLFNLGLAVFTLASAACGVAPNAGWLIAGRAAQGIGAALLAPQVLALLGVLFGGADRPRAFAAYGLVLGLASAGGQMIGGVLIHAGAFGLGWRGCFLVNVPIGVIASLLAGALVPESRATAGARLDLRGAALVTLSIALLLLSLIEGRERGWPAWTWACLAAAPLSLAVFAMQQRRRARCGEAVLLDPVLWRAPRFRVGLLAVLSLFGGVASLFLVLALYLQQGSGLDALASGLIAGSMALAFSVTSLSAGRIGRRRGRPPLLIGALGMAIGLIGLGITAATDGGALLPLIAWLVFDGAAMGLVMAPLVSTVLAGMPPGHAGAAAGVLATMQQLANALGVALIGLVYFGLLRSAGDATAFAASAACLALLALVLAALVWRLLRD